MTSRKRFLSCSIRGYRFQDTVLFLALFLWVCALPLLAFAVLPFLGWKVTASIAVGLLVVDLVICSYICRVRVPTDPVICTKVP